MKTHFDQAGWSNSVVNMNDSESIRKAASIDLNNLEESERKQKMRAMHELHDNLMSLLEKKKLIEAKAKPNPGVNKKREFNDVKLDIIKNPVDIPKYSGRKPFYEQVPVFDGPHEERFVAFNSIPDVNSKYKFSNVPNFENYSYRNNPQKELKEADKA